MKYYMQVENGYIIAIGENISGIELTETKYNEIKEIIAARPAETETIGYHLKEDFTWEYYEKEIPENYDIDDIEAYNIIFGDV